MRCVTAKTHTDAMLDIVGKYLTAGGKKPIDLDEVARFAINEGLWAKSTSQMVQLCKRDFARAFREQYHTDEQGRHVRTYHATISKGGQKQCVFWDDIRTASKEHMEAAFQQRRSQIVGDCRQLKLDVDSYNDNNAHGGRYQLPLDFREDVAELEQPIKYLPNKPR